MLQIKTFQVNMLQENCYVVSDATGDCAIIDPGMQHEAESRAVVSYIRDNGLTPRHVLLTHAHLDHCFGVAALHDAFGLAPRLADADDHLYATLDQQARQFYGLTLEATFPDPADEPLTDGQTLVLGSHQLHVIATPGHSRGSVCLHCPDERVLFSGDTLFRTTIGRTDLPGGNRFLIISSLRRLAMLPDDTRVYPGHGEPTTMGYELSHNPYMDR